MHYLIKNRYNIYNYKSKTLFKKYVMHGLFLTIHMLPLIFLKHLLKQIKQNVI